MLETKTDVELIAHLLRRAGFGATRDELEKYSSMGYEAAVEGLLNPGEEQRISDYLVRRFHPELSGMMGPQAPGENWLYRMATTTALLQEKMTLFWHSIFATGYNKVIHGKALSDQTRMFRHHAMGSFKTLLVELSKDPAMIIWLDNQDNHKGSINENYGRELLELFSMGVGNYTEEDIKECARAFTGWTIANREYMELRSQRDSDWPYGRISWHFEFHSEDHDYGEKTFLGETGNFDGEDIVDIICRQPATARFIARHLYSYFVADEPPVPEWPYTPPRDPDAIETLVQPTSTTITASAQCSGCCSTPTSSSRLTSATKRSRVPRSWWPEFCGSPASSTGPATRSLTATARQPTWARCSTTLPASRDGTKAPTGWTAARWWSASTSPANRSATRRNRVFGQWSNASVPN